MIILPYGFEKNGKKEEASREAFVNELYECLLEKTTIKRENNKRGEISQLQTRSKFHASKTIPINGRGRFIPQTSIFFPDIVVNSYHKILGKIQDILEKIQDLQTSSWPASER